MPVLARVGFLVAWAVLVVATSSWSLLDASHFWLWAIITVGAAGAVAALIDRLWALAGPWALAFALAIVYAVDAADAETCNCEPIPVGAVVLLLIGAAIVCDLAMVLAIAARRGLSEG